VAERDGVVAASHHARSASAQSGKIQPPVDVLIKKITSLFELCAAWRKEFAFPFLI
jgi:hypothetical protein